MAGIAAAMPWRWGANLGQPLGHADSRPLFAVQRLADDVLDFGIAECLRLAHEERQLPWQLAAALHQAGNRLGQVVEVD
jgi:hypothetical protein